MLIFDLKADSYRIKTDLGWNTLSGFLKERFVEGGQEFQEMEPCIEPLVFWSEET
jgi:hypothetical protein